MNNAIRVKIYSGLSLDEATAKRFLPNATFSRPIRRGDLRGDIRSKYHIICIIDGSFHHFPAVNCGEIMDAMRAGVRIYGASSMGALRASELDGEGMIGHGKIYAYIKNSTFFRDDYLGQTFEESAGKTRPSSLPYIDLYFALKRKLERAQMNKTDMDIILRVYGDLHYSDRNPTSLFGELKVLFSRRSDLIRSVKSALASSYSQKREDAIDLLKQVKKDVKRIYFLNQALNG